MRKRALLEGFLGFKLYPKLCWLVVFPIEAGLTL